MATLQKWRQDGYWDNTASTENIYGQLQVFPDDINSILTLSWEKTLKQF